MNDIETLSELLSWSCDQFLFGQQMGKKGYWRVFSMGSNEK